jgi:hypothetical protein
MFGEQCLNRFQTGAEPMLDPAMLNDPAGRRQHEKPEPAVRRVLACPEKL